MRRSRRPFTRTALTAAAVSLLAASVVAVTPDIASAEATTYCIGAPADAPCIVTVTRDGVPIESTDPTYDVFLTRPMAGQISWSVSMRGGGFVLPDADLATTWSVTVNTRAMAPRVTFAHSTRGPVTRSKTLDGDNLVTMTGKPVTVTGGCAGDATCPLVATEEWRSYLDGSIYEAGWYADTGVQAAAWNGASMWTNIDWSSFPPQVPPGGGLQIDIANSHYRVDGTTPVSGFIYEDLPYTLVKQALFVEDPTSLVGGSLVPALTGTGSGSVNVYADDAASMLYVSGSGISFSHRALVVKRGVVTPKTGTVLSARRASPRTTVKVTVARGISRGARLTGYNVRCYRLSGRTQVSVRTAYLAIGHGIVIYVKSVGTTGTRYCQVRVNSTRGYGAWSKQLKVT